MTEFTRVDLNTRNRSVRKALTSLERLHAIVARATSSVGTTLPEADSTPVRTLWRIDMVQHKPAAKLYISSAAVPDFEVLHHELGIAEKEIDTCEYDSFLSRLSIGQEWGFRLKANPSKSESKRESKQRGRVLALVKEDEQQAWLLRQALKYGFHMPIDRMESPEMLVRSAKAVRFKRRGVWVTLNEVVFDGVLAVDDPELMRRAMLQGIGRAKGYGFGMLTLVPLVGHRYRGVTA